MTASKKCRELETREVRRPDRDRVWSKPIEDQILDIVARTGSPSMAAKAAGVSPATIHDHRKRDLEFGARYAQAMDSAFHNVLGRAFERSLDEVEPSDRLIEVLLKFRWPERLNGFLAVTGDGDGGSSAPAGLDPRVIAKMEPADRAALIDLLGRYLVVETEVQADAALIAIN